ncbi:KaiC domain-containing protein [Halomicrobium sp. LC1Hm]|uniref:KaiC domain-containing protein n=1 Tax=Halomicrobium sp. LC1Hm TaxID=2610902 RepID=UPI0012983569|nr:KaiC domain-containing protein [Halomicrobium sp. LC1Hm]QGA81766.1 RecA-superfamily ATPase implicated in signal transduction [Halomicrobium sp. LC1Hm]
MSEDDDDWFESAVDESDDGESEPADSDSAFEADADSDSPFDGDDSSGEAAGSSPFDGGTDGASPFDGGTDEAGPFEDDDDGSLFDDDFESAFASAGDPSDDSEGFEDEDFESEIPRIDLGIDGLDQMIQGGIPERHLIVTIGSAGTGKTTFGLQFLHHGLEQGDNAVFITLEQSREAIIATAEERGWEFEHYEDTGQLAVVDLDPVEMANSLDNIRGELPALIEEFDADRLVLDSVSLLEMMYDDQAKRRTEVFDFTRSLKNAGVTTMLTSEASEDNPYASRHGIIEYLTDAVFVLQYVRTETRETRLAVEIQKIRNANHSRETKPYEITMDGISVYQQANIF